MKLKCFHCKRKFLNKNEIFRDRNEHPVCEDCCYEDIGMDFDDEDNIIEQIRSGFNRNYKKFLKYLDKECRICNECDTWYPKDFFVDEMCQNCFESKILKNEVQRIK